MVISYDDNKIMNYTNSVMLEDNVEEELNDNIM